MKSTGLVTNLPLTPGRQALILEPGRQSCCQMATYNKYKETIKVRKSRDSYADTLYCVILHLFRS